MFFDDPNSDTKSNMVRLVFFQNLNETKIGSQVFLSTSHVLSTSLMNIWTTTTISEISMILINHLTVALILFKIIPTHLLNRNHVRGLKSACLTGLDFIKTLKSTMTQHRKPYCSGVIVPYETFANILDVCNG